MQIDSSINSTNEEMTHPQVELPIVPTEIETPEVPENNPKQDRLDRLFPQSRKNLNWDVRVGFSGGSASQRKPHQIVLFSWLASLVDGLLLVAMSALFLMAFATVLQTDFGSILKLFMAHSVLAMFIQIYIMFAMVYLIFMRVFFGSTVGEWVCDLRLGQPHDRLSSNYWMRVTLRTFSIFFTGIFILPLFSLVSGKDFSGDLTGLRLISLK